MITRREVSQSSTWVSGGGSSVATEASVGGEYGEGGWGPCSGKAPLLWWFSEGVVLLSASSVGPRSLGSVNISVCRVILHSSYSVTLYICWSSRMWLSSSGVLTKLVGKFLGDSEYSESPSLSP